MREQGGADDFDAIIRASDEAVRRLNTLTRSIQARAHLGRRLIADARAILGNEAMGARAQARAGRCPKGTRAV